MILLYIFYHKICIGFLLFTGKYNKPRCFKNVHTLPVNYVANKKAWMTSSIFCNYLKKWDTELIKNCENIILLVDNCPAHPQVQLQNIKLIFLPPNSTSVLQPMDQGIIWALKQNFRKQLLLTIIQRQDSNDTEIISILDAINLLSSAWRNISAETIQNCFRHAGFIQNDNHVVLREDFDPEDDIPLKLIASTAHLDVDKFVEYVNVDKNVIATEILTDQEIVHQITTSDIEDEEEPETVITPDDPITTAQALEYIRKVQHYFQVNGAKENTFSILLEIQNTLNNQYLHTQTIQSKITDFFTT